MTATTAAATPTPQVRQLTVVTADRIDHLADVLVDSVTGGSVCDAIFYRRRIGG